MNAVTHRRGFTLTELLVAVAIILGLMTLIGGAVSAARGSQKKQATKALIAKLDAIIQQQYATYATRPVASVAAAKTADIAAARRQMATADMPDNWKEIQAIKEGTTALASHPERRFPLNAAQRAYVQYRDAVTPSPKYEDAECLFMIVMLGGLADCLDCGGLGLSEKGDKDGDNAAEFLDAWGNPIGFVLWPAGLEIPPGKGKFFSSVAPFSGSISAVQGGVMRPLIYSAGPDGDYAIRTPDTEAANPPFVAQIKSGTNCGNPADAAVQNYGSFPSGDDITNFDDEVGR